MRKMTMNNGRGILAAVGSMTTAERAKGRYMRDASGHPPAGAPLELKTWLQGIEKKLEQHGVDAGTVRDINARLTDLEQKSGRGGGDGMSPATSLGAAFVRAPELKEFASDLRVGRAIQIETKTITSVSASAGALATQPYRDQPANIPQTKLSIRDLLTVIPIETNSVEVPRQTARTNNAGMVAEGDLKPQSDYAWQLLTIPVRKIAHWILVSQEILVDAPQLRGTIDSELVYGVAFKEDQQLLKGDGTGQNLPGLIPAATAFVDPLELAAANYIDTIGAALLQSALADFPADGIVLHPSDWMRMRLLKDTQGKYLLGDPGSDAPPVLFGKPVVETKAMTPGDFLVGQFKVAATLYDRMNTTVMISTEDSDNFRRNLATLLAEERVALAIKQGGALTHGTFPAGS